MKLHVHRSGDAFLEALASDTGSFQVIFSRSGTDPRTLRRSEILSRERGHSDITGVRELRVAAEKRLRRFFELAAEEDPQWRYAYSARVPLAIPEFADVGLVFLLRALKHRQPDAVVHALIADPWQAALVRFEVDGGKPPAFRAGARRGVMRLLRSAARRAYSPHPPPKCDVLIFTLGDSVSRGAPDTYFGHFATALTHRCSVQTVFTAGGTRLRFPHRAGTLPLEAFLHLPDVVRAWAAARQASRGRDPVATGDDALLHYLRAREHAAGEVPMLGLLARMFDRMIATLKPGALVYPFENRGWEKLLLRAARRHGVSHCVGYQHSSLTPRHLAFSDGANELPDTILTCGEATADLIRAAMPQARALLQVGAALRARRMDVAPPAVFGVLAPISSSRGEAWEILRVLQEFVEHSDAPVLVRPHPAIPMDDLFAQFSWPDRVRLSGGGPLADDFHGCALIAYSSSTVALEGMLYGRLPVFLEISDFPSGNPIQGEHDFLFRAASGRELAEVTARIRGYAAGEITRLRDHARAYAERYLIDPTPERVARMAQIVARC